jgi:hypothetical protein
MRRREVVMLGTLLGVSALVGCGGEQPAQVVPTSSAASTSPSTPVSPSSATKQGSTDEATTSTPSKTRTKRPKRPHTKGPGGSTFTTAPEDSGP